MPRTPRIPDASHPITIGPAGEHIVVSVEDTVVADTTSALSLREASYPPVLYIPREDVNDSVLAPSTTETYCPFKGDASYFNLRSGEAAVADVAWSYEEPYPAVAEITGHLAFYPDRVSVRVEQD